MRRSAKYGVSMRGGGSSRKGSSMASKSSRSPFDEEAYLIDHIFNDMDSV
jgi:hypothetical protein